MEFHPHFRQIFVSIRLDSDKFDSNVRFWLTKFDEIFYDPSDQISDHHKKIQLWILLDPEVKSKRFYDQTFMSFCLSTLKQENTKMD